MDGVLKDEAVLLDKGCLGGTTHEAAQVGASSLRNSKS